MEVWDTFIPSHTYGRRDNPLSRFKKPDAEQALLVRQFVGFTRTIFGFHRAFWQRQPQQNCSRIGIWPGTFSPYVQWPLMAAKKGSENAGIRRQQLCKIQLNLEAEIEDGQQLYVSGSATSLGSWEPQLAIALTPCKGQRNVWQAEIQVPRGANLEYNYFVRDSKIVSGNLIWRPGPTLCLTLPSSGRNSKKKIVVQDSWERIVPRKLPVLSWGSWWEDIGPPGLPSGFISFESSIEDDFVTEHSSLYYGHMNLQPANSESSTSSANICDVSNNPERPRIETPANLEQDIINSKLFPGEVLRRNGFDLARKHWNIGSAQKGGQPTEEPWLLAGPLLSKPENISVNLTIGRRLEEDISFANPDEDLQKTSQAGHEGQAVEMAAPQENVGVVLDKDKDVTTEIVINSSVCTMQRVAILEDGKLVELLLEPVKTSVQVGSVYLGVVKKLLPHMSGAFVDIGSTRSALMAITKNKKPYTFPSLESRGKENESNGILTNSTWNDILEKDDSSLQDEEEDFHDFLESEVQEDEISMIYEDEYDEQQVIEEELEESDNVVKGLNNNMADINNISTIGMDVGDYLHGHEHDIQEETCGGCCSNAGYGDINNKEPCHKSQNVNSAIAGSLSANFGRKLKNWMHIREGTKIIVQVNKEELGTKGPQITAYPRLTSRFWVLAPRLNIVGVSRKISGVERTRLKLIAKTLQPPGVGLTVRTVAAGHSFEELEKDLIGLLETWKEIVEHAKSAVLAAEEGVEGAVPVILHRAMGQTLSVVQDSFNEKVRRMVVDSPRTYHEVTSYLQEVAPGLCNRVELYTGKDPIFDKFGVEEEIDNFLSKRVYLPNGGYLVIEQTEALVSIDVNGGSGMLGRKTSQEQAILEVNLAAARQIARELRLRDIGGIIVVDFIDMNDDKNKRLVYEEMKKAVERDRSVVTFSEVSELGLMEMTRKRVRPSVTFMISQPCSCCQATGRVEALKTTFSKIERAIRRLLARRVQQSGIADGKSWPRILLQVDPVMSDYLTSGKKSRIAQLSSSLKVWIVLKVAREFERGQFEVNDAVKNTPNKHHQAGMAGTHNKRTRSNVLGKNVRIWPFKRQIRGDA